MAKIEIKPITITTQCACGRYNARHKIIIKGTSKTTEIPLCNDCFKELKEKMAPQELIEDED